MTCPQQDSLLLVTRTQLAAEAATYVVLLTLNMQTLSKSGWHLGRINLYLSDMKQLWASLVAQSVKNLRAVQETRVRSLNWEDPLEREMAAHSSILAWKIPWTEEPGRLPSMGSQRVRHDWATSLTYLLIAWKRGLWLGLLNQWYFSQDLKI